MVDMSTPLLRPRRGCGVLLLLVGAFWLPLSGQTEDAEGCKDHALFNRMPGFHIVECKQSQFDLKRFPIGPPTADGSEAKSTEVEGAFFFLKYELMEGSTKPSPLQTMRNFQNAAKKTGGAVIAEYPGWCKAALDETLHTGNGCILYGTTLKFAGQGKETWAFVESNGEGESYEIWLVERQAMKQDIAVGEIRQGLDKDGFVAVYINFDTGSATIQQDSMSQLQEIVKLLQADTALKLEIGGHTDNVGAADANQKLSESRANAVMAALVKAGVAAGRLTAKGYGQTIPIADNRKEDGRAKNRRVELLKR
jgi:outer membrane protein OmpA-like peptidoglycan-associated protein